MQTNDRNKMIASAQNKTEAPLLEYHFAGSGEYVPQTVRACSKVEAQAEWEKSRQALGTVPVEPLEEST